MEKSQLKDNPLEAPCFFINQNASDPRVLTGIIKAEEVDVNGKKFYNPSLAFCLLARRKPDYFKEMCPNWQFCSYADGKSHDVNTTKLER